MKIVLDIIEEPLDTGKNSVYELVIENQNVFCSILSDLKSQINGFEGRSILSEDNKELSLSKYAEVIDCFIPFELTRKTLISKIMSCIDAEAGNQQNLNRTNELLAEIEKYLLDISLGLKGNIGFDNLTMLSLLKAASIQIEDEYDNLSERVIDYFELITEYERKKLFVLVNIRSYISDDECTKLVDTLNRQQYEAILLESSDRPCIKGIQKIIIDADQCVIM